MAWWTSVQERRAHARVAASGDPGCSGARQGDTRDKKVYVLDEDRAVSAPASCPSVLLRWDKCVGSIYLFLHVLCPNYRYAPCASFQFQCKSSCAYTAYIAETDQDHDQALVELGARMKAYTHLLECAEEKMAVLGTYSPIPLLDPRAGIRARREMRREQRCRADLEQPYRTQLAREWWVSGRTGYLARLAVRCLVRLAVLIPVFNCSLGNQDRIRRVQVVFVWTFHGFSSFRRCATAVCLTRPCRCARR